MGQVQQNLGKLIRLSYWYCLFFNSNFWYHPGYWTVLEHLQLWSQYVSLHSNIG
jgi:hypothetical protein